jgi:acyl-CoA oxidase
MSTCPLEAARSKVSFNSELLETIYWGSKEMSNKWKNVQEVVANDPILKYDPTEYGKSRDELFEIYCQKTYRLHKLLNYNDSDVSYMAFSMFPQAMISLLH